MKLGMMITAHCNAACTHCSTSCGPQKNEALSREKIFSLMDQAAELSKGEPLKFGFSGGEPFLDFDLLLRALAHGKALGAEELTCVTNGYWATSQDKAVSTLRAVQDAGLNVLAVSTSRFHQQFVKLQRVERVLCAAREIGLSCTLKVARVQSDPEKAEDLEAWARARGADCVQIFSVLPHLREGATLPESDYERGTSGLPEGRCPAPIMTVREDGTVYTCCTPGAQGELLALGNTHETSLKQVQDRYYLGAPQQILRDQGPIHFARAAIERGQGARLRDSYSSICDMCAHIVSDPVLAAIATDTAQAFEVRQVEEILNKLPA